LQGGRRRRAERALVGARPQWQRHRAADAAEVASALTLFCRRHCRVLTRQCTGLANRSEALLRSEPAARMSEAMRGTARVIQILFADIAPLVRAEGGGSQPASLRRSLLGSKRARKISASSGSSKQ